MSRYSVIVPTYKEQGNLEELTRRLFTAFNDKGFGKGCVELIIVDDNSCDGTAQTVEKLSRNYNIRLIERKTERGLSSAVIAGINSSVGEYLLVMDADLQHPPEVAPQMMAELDKGNTEFVSGTRYAAGSAVDKSWPMHRRVISWGARLLARPLSPLSDPMSGLFALRRCTYCRGKQSVNPIGYKIALELFVKCHVKRHSEVGIRFGARTFGESKLSSKVIVNYLLHLCALYFYRFRWIVFGLGVLMLALCVAGCYELFGLHHLGFCKNRK